jgi:hypothetical protein
MKHRGAQRTQRREEENINTEGHRGHREENIKTEKRSSGYWRSIGSV